MANFLANINNCQHFKCSNSFFSNLPPQIAEDCYQRNLSMSTKVKFEQEYILKTSPNVLNNMLMTPSGLSEWMADDVNVKEDIFTFIWDGSEEQARLISKKRNEFIKFRWLEDEEDGINSYLEMRFEVDPMTKEVVFRLTSFAFEDELEETQLYWQSTIEELRRVIGA